MKKFILCLLVLGLSSPLLAKTKPGRAYDEHVLSMEKGQWCKALKGFIRLDWKAPNYRDTRERIRQCLQRIAFRENYTREEMKVIRMWNQWDLHCLGIRNDDGWITCPVVMEPVAGAG